MGLAYKVSSPNDFGFNPDCCHTEIHHCNGSASLLQVSGQHLALVTLFQWKGPLVHIK